MDVVRDRGGTRRSCSVVRRVRQGGAVVGRQGEALRIYRDVPADEGRDRAIIFCSRLANAGSFSYLRRKGGNMFIIEALGFVILFVIIIALGAFTAASVVLSYIYWIVVAAF